MSTPPSPSLDRTLISGLGWNAASRWGGQVISWLSTLVVIRLLTPEDYGIAAMAGVLFGLVNLVVDGGLGAAIVSRGEHDPGRLGQLHTVSILLGVAAAAFVALLAGPMAWFFREPRLVALVLVVSLMYLVIGFRVVPLARLQRDLAFRTLARNDLLWVASGAVVSVACAAAGLGYWALIIGPVAGAAVATLAAWYSAPQHPVRPRLAELRDTLVFGAQLLVSRLAAYVNGIAATVVIGRRLGQEPLGGYRVAADVASLPLDKVVSVMQQVAAPVFAAVRDDRAALGRYLALVTEGLALAAWPLAFGLALVADLAVPLVLGEQWVAAVVPMRILALAAAVRAVIPPLNAVAQARGHALLLARVGLLGTPLLVAALLVGSRWGVTGVATAWAIGMPLLSLRVLWVVQRDIGLGLRRYLAALAPAAGAAAVMVVAVLGARWGLEGRLTPLPLLVLLVTTGAVAYAGTAWRLAGQRLLQLRTLLRPGAAG